jgi:hypothetical protein
MNGIENIMKIKTVVFWKFTVMTVIVILTTLNAAADEAEDLAGKLANSEASLID